MTTNSQQVQKGALLPAVRDMIATFVQQKGTTSIAILLAQAPEIMGPLVIEAIEDLAHEGTITVQGKYGLAVAWAAAGPA